MNNRIMLPYRKNCEGYFFFKKKILCQDTGKGYLLFPGGGFNENESAGEAIIRETFEETGAIIKNLKKIRIIYFDWDEDWAKTSKQKQRYNHFRGEEMHLFVGEVKEIKDENGNEEDCWKGERFMDIFNAIKLLESMKPFPSNMKEYYSSQLKILKENNETR